ncbi:DUF1273 domain-containing protein [uncultured Lactobacillus sp.]|uniref:DUF1273 domain-containing protein n=1 Tax=uncultured Lactobacillus sp. TaxID=153152 RepID=UPI00260ACFFD|nr:DUF1273 domain-containing protein [uncultured Lactobacillus sp.]
MQRLWISGYRSFELGVFDPKDKKIVVIKYAIKNYLKRLIDEGQLDWVISGPNLGIEQWALQSAIELRNEYNLHCSMITPYIDFSKRWNESNQAQFSNLKQEVDFFASTSKSPYQSPIQLRSYQNFMINHTDRALLVYDPEHPGKPHYDYDLIQKYQKQKDYPLNLIDFYDLQDAAQEYSENHNPDFY